MTHLQGQATSSDPLIRKTKTSALPSLGEDTSGWCFKDTWSVVAQSQASEANLEV